MSIPQSSGSRPKAPRTFSLGSNNSHNSKGSGKGHRQSISESAEEKRRSAFNRETKANPNAAIVEAEPVAAALEKPTLGSLRSISHTDIHGNAIAEPDLSNPTRPRWERPLDTIRSFEAAIDSRYGGGGNRQSYYRQDQSFDGTRGYTNRRSSYYGSENAYNNRQPRFSANGGYYGNRQSRDAYNDDRGPPVNGPPRGRYGQMRMHSEPNYNHGQQQQQQHYGAYPNNGYHQSRDTVNTGESSGSQSDNNAYTTDPSSDNSSVERFTPPTKPEPQPSNYDFPDFGGAPQYNGPIMEHGNYGANGVRPAPPPHGNSSGNGYGYNQQGSHQQAPPPPPKNGLPKNGLPMRRPVGAAGAGGYPASQQQIPVNSGPPPVRPQLQSGASEKRKSWIKRRFSSRKD